MKHTPTPWKADGTDICQNNNRHFHVIANVKLFRHYDADDIRNKQSAPDEHQLLVELNVPIDGDEKANAEHIVKCVNSHDELLEAVIKSKLVIEKMRDVFMDTGTEACKEAIQITNEFLEYIEKAINASEVEG